MSTSGLTNQYNPPTLDGLTIIEADELYVGGQNVDVTTLVPYVGATQTLNMGTQNIQTTHVPVAGADVVNLDTLTNAVTFVDNSVALTYLNKITTSAQTVAGQVTFSNPVIANNTFTLTPQTADRVLVLDADKKVVSSGINTTKLGYLDNVSSDIQASLNSKLNLSGSNANQDIVLSSYKVQSSAVPSTGNDYTNKTYVDGAITGLSSLYLPLTGGTLSGALTVNAGVSVGTRLLGTPDGAGSGNFWMGLRGSGTEGDRVAIAIVGAETTGVVSRVTIAKPLFLNDPTTGRVLGIDGTSKVVATSATTTEASYLSGVTSSIQVQLDAKANTSALANYVLKAGDTMSGNLLVNARIGVNQSSPQWRIHASNTNAWATSGSYTKADGIMALGGKDNNADYQYLIFPNPSQTDGGVTGMSWWSSDMITGRYKNEFRLAWWKETHSAGLGNAYKEGISLYLTDSGGFTDLDYIKLNGKTDINGQVSIGLSSNTTPNIKFSNALNHISNSASEAWLFTGYSGHIAIGRNATRDATTTNLMLGVASTEEAQIISRNTNDTAYKPLSFASSLYSFVGGNVGIGTASPGYLLDVNGAGRVRGSFHVGLEGDATSQIYFGGPSGDTPYNHTVIQCRKYNEAGEGSELVLFKGNDIQEGSLLPDRIRLRGANICFDTYPFYSQDPTAENIRMTIKQDGRVGIKTTTPEGDLHVQLAGAVSDYWGKLVVKTTSFWGDGCSVRSETAGTQYATMFPMMFLNPQVVSDTDGWAYIRMGRSGGVASGRWWEIANRSDGYFQIGVERSNQLSINPNGAVNVCGGSPYAVTNGRMTAGSLTIGSTDRNYGGGTGSWNPNTAALMLECADNTEIAIHDSGTRLVSALYYQGAQNFLAIGRDMGEGSPAYVLVPTALIANRISVIADDANGRMNIRNPNGNTTHFGWVDNRNYIRNNTIFDTGYVEIGAAYVFRAPLDITTTVGRDNGGVRYFDYFGGLNFTNWYSYSAMADTWGGSRFMAYSDVRKKKNIQPVVNALQTLDDIRIVSYDHIDVAQPPNYWGVIAQEVEAKYPHLITSGKEYLPNIYKDAVAHHCTDCGCFVWLEMEEEQDMTMVGKSLRLYTFDEEEKKEYEEHTDVIKVEGKRIKVKKWVKGQEERYVPTERVFVYGTLEEDVRTVDKTQFGLLAVSACKELKHEVKTLSSRIGVLEAREVMWEQHARQQEATIKEQEERLKKAEANLEKVAGLLQQLISSK